MTDKLKKILLGIENGKIKSLYDTKINFEDLLLKDDNGITFLEHLLKNRISLYALRNEIKNNIEIANIFIKCKESLYLFDFDEKALFSMVNGKRFIDFLLEEDKLTSGMITNVKENLEIVDILIKFKKEYMLKYLSSEIIGKLLTKNNEEVYLIEKYIENKNVVDKLINSVDDIDKLIELCIKYNNYELLTNANENILTSKYNDDYLLNYLVKEKNIIPEVLKNIPNNIEFVNFLIRNNYCNYLENTTESVQLLEVQPKKTLLEFLIENGYNPKLGLIWEEKTIALLHKLKKLDLIKDTVSFVLTKPASEVLKDDSIEDETFLEYMLDNGYNPLENEYYIQDDEIIKILHEKHRFDLLAKVRGEKLLEFKDNTDTYFDLILESVKEGKTKVSIKNLHPYNCSIDVIVNYYLAVAKKDMMEYIDELTEDDLLKKYGETMLLEGLLNVDSDLTVNKVLTNSVKSKPSIAAILKSHGIEQKDVNVSKEDHFSKDYLEKVENSLGIGPLLTEGEVLLQKLQQLFLSDGKSDEGLINALISGYRHALFVDYESNIKEIKNLISVKEQNLDKFFYKRADDGSYFSSANGSVFCDSEVVETILHETGHAMHYYLAENRVPDDYQDIIRKIRENQKTLEKVEKYADKYAKLYQEIKLLVEQKYKDFFASYYDENKKEEIRQLLSKSKLEKKEEFRELKIPEEQLDVLLNDMFTEEEYIAHQKRIFIKENVDAIIRSDFGALMAIGDILDAIYEGNLHSYNLKNQQGEKIKKTAGHGLRYYYSTNHGFDEMIANFSSISKSKDSKEMLEFLKEIVGDELYNMLSSFYYENIVNLNKEQLESGRGIGGK